MFTKIIIAILSIYFVSLVSISLFQRKLLYHPKINNHAETYKLNHQIDVISINSDHQLVGWHHKKEGNR